MTSLGIIKIHTDVMQDGLVKRRPVKLKTGLVGLLEIPWALRIGSGPLRFATIVDVVCVYYGITKLGFESQSHRPRFVWPRRYAFYFARRLTSLSYPNLGKLAAGRSHTAAWRGERITAARIAKNPALAAELREILSVLAPKQDQAARAVELFNTEK